MNIHLKSRPGGHTFQIVRWCYDPNKKRSVTKTLGSIPITADPDDFADDLKLTTGITLSREQETQIANALRQKGCPKAAARRAAQQAKLETVIHESKTGDSFEFAIQALDRLSQVLPELAKAYPETEERWQQLRPKHQAMHEAIERYRGSAKSIGITKTRRQSNDGNDEVVE